MTQEHRLNAMSHFKCPPCYSFPSKPNPKDKTCTPGPGAYGVPSDAKFSRSASYSMGSGVRDDGRVWGVFPGPGQHPVVDCDKYRERQRNVVFSTSGRPGPSASKAGPGPGQYETRGGLEGLQTSIAGRPAYSKREGNPGPGKYNPDCPALKNGRSVSFGASCRNELVPSKLPGPGTYEALDILNGNVAMRAPPKFSIKGRYNQPASHETPGPIAAGSTFK